MYNLQCIGYLVMQYEVSTVFSSPGVTLLLPLTDKECRDINGPCNQPQCVARNIVDFPCQGELLTC